MSSGSLMIAHFTSGHTRYPCDRVRRSHTCVARSPAKEKVSLPPKYQDPKTGATWTGRGRAPAWLGKNRDKFLIAE